MAPPLVERVDTSIQNKCSVVNSECCACQVLHLALICAIIHSQLSLDPGHEEKTNERPGDTPRPHQ
jgi:hypothetical protein